MSRKERIEQLLARLRQGVYEKEEAVRLALLAALAGESVFLLGPPGVAKSLIARKLKFAFREGRSFEYLMSRFSTPDEIFGPVSIRKLKDEDKYERLTDKYLPGASVVFLDEIWKAGPAIQNALLTVLNERIYRNGEQEVKVEVKAIVAASNELPATDEGLAALWDRFLVRCGVREIQQAGLFVEMITDTADAYRDEVEDALKISTAELEAWESEINAVELPPEVLNVIQIIKQKIDHYDEQHPEQPFRVYDRRWKKMVRLLRTAAFLNERPAVDLMDVFLLPHCLWNRPEQLEIAQELTAETVRRHGYTLALNLTPLKNEIRQLEADTKAEVCIPHTSLVDKLRLLDREYYEVLNLDQYFDGRRIKATDFDRLSRDEDSTLNLYDAQGSLTNRLKARRAAGATEILVRHNERTYTFALLADKEEKAETIYKKPHPVVQRHWNDHIHQLKMYVREQTENLESHLPESLRHLRTNLFVEAPLSRLVEENLEESRRTLAALDLQLDKIKHFYESVH